MRNSFLIGFSVLYFFISTDLTEVCKIPQLIRHFEQHHDQNPTISFWTFLRMHYAGDDGDDVDNNEDMKLPFHNSDAHYITSLYSFSGCGVFYAIPVKPAIRREYVSLPVAHLLPSHSNLIFHPPEWVNSLLLFFPGFHHYDEGWLIVFVYKTAKAQW